MTSNVDRWTAHFKAMARGEVHPDKNGYYRVAGGSGSKLRGEGPQREGPNIKMVTPVAQAIEIAKADIKDEKLAELGPPGDKKKKRSGSLKKKKRSGSLKKKKLLKRLVGGRKKVTKRRHTTGRKQGGGKVSKTVSDCFRKK